MKKFNEIDGIADIEVKTDFCELRIALYNTRGVIRKYLYAYAFPSLANKFIEDLTAEANKVKQVKAQDKIKETQETIITKIQHLISKSTSNHLLGIVVLLVRLKHQLNIKCEYS